MLLEKIPACSKYSKCGDVQSNGKEQSLRHPEFDRQTAAVPDGPLVR